MFRFSLVPSARLIAASIAVLSTGIAMAREPSTTDETARAEVVVDYVLWRRAGLSEFDLVRVPGTESEYQRRLAIYRQLRDGPEFAAEVARRGGSTATKAPTTGASAK